MQDHKAMFDQHYRKLGPAQSWADWADRISGPGSSELVRISEAYEDALICGRVPDGAYILDSGCGFGGLTRKLGALGCVVGIDISSVMLGYARENVPGVPLSLCASEMLPFGGQTFDVVVLREVLEHLYSPIEALGESCRVLKRGGLVIITTPLPPVRSAKLRVWQFARRAIGKTGPRRKRVEWDVKNEVLTPGDVRELLVGAGFAVVEFRAFGFQLPGLNCVLRRLPVRALGLVAKALRCVERFASLRFMARQLWVARRVGKW